MDYKDYQKGATQDFFWFRAKNEVIHVLLCKLRTKKALKILNLGGGTGSDLSVIKEFGEIYVIDIDPKALELVPDRFVHEKRVCDACQMPYPDSYFDLVVAFDVLEHIEDDGRVISEIYRVLKPTGYFVFTVPAFNFLYSSHDRALNHFRRYEKSTIKNLLSSFKCIELGYWVFSLFIPVLIQRILKRKESVSEVHFMKLPKTINGFLYSLLKIENLLIKHRIPLPVGTTIYGIYQI